MIMKKMDKESLKNSFTAADSLPIKLITDYGVMKKIRDKKVIPPIHAQFIPTNRCNMSCPFCSCAEDDRNTEISLPNAKKIIDGLADLGTLAVTITGGGEPILHPYFDEIVEYFSKYNIEIGLVTNGLLLNAIDSTTLDKIKWCRISNGDHRKFTAVYKENLYKAISLHPEIDWSFSHVVSKDPNYPEIKILVEFANANNFTHIRLVSDLLEPDTVPMDSVKEYLENWGVDTSIVIFQPRKQANPGGPCYIGYLKPLIGADCKVYACCGVQYAFDPPPKHLPKELCLGSAFNMKTIIKNSRKPLDGSICTKCYYQNYNQVLRAAVSDIEHRKFL